MGGLRQCGALVLRRLCERSLGRPDEPRLITDEEMAQLVWDSRRLSNDLAGHSLLPCLPMPAWEGWRQWSPERPPTARVLTRRGERGTRRQGGCDEGRTQTLGGVPPWHLILITSPALRARITAAVGEGRGRDASPRPGGRGQARSSALTCARLAEAPLHPAVTYERGGGPVGLERALDPSLDISSPAGRCRTCG